MAISSPIKPSTFLVPFRLRELKVINGLSKKLYEEKRTRFLLEKRLYKLEQKSLEKRQLQERESSQESNKNKLSLKSSAKRVVRNAAVGLGSFLFDLLQFFITYKVVEWVSKPENSKKVVSIVKALKGIFDFLSWFVTGTIDNAFSGLHSVIFGENLLERFLGFFRLVIGLLGFRYLLKPGKLFKDLGFVLKNSGKILDVFNSFRKAGLKEGSEKLLQTLPKTAAVFKRGLARGLGRGLLKVFGKGGVRILSKLLGPAFKAVKNIVLGPIKAVAKTTVKGIPIVGPLLDLGINLILGDPIDKAIVKAAGSALGMGLGGLVGSAFPGPGTIVGGALGGLLGDWAADKLYGWVKGLFSKKSDDVPQLATGGIVTKETKAIIGEDGPEAVIPLPQLLSGSIFSGPFSALASSLIGGVNAVLFSMGPVGNIIRPFAQQLFAPFVRDFGIKRFTFASSLGNTVVNTATLTTKSNASENKELEKIVGKNKQLNLISDKSSNKKARYNTGNTIRELLADIFNNIINLDFTAPDSNGTGGGGGGGGAEGPSSFEATEWKKDPEFANAVNAVAKHFNIRANDLLGLMASESGLNPKADNGTHVGLIQFSATSARGAGTTQAALKNMTRAQQMPYVQKYLENAGLPRGATAGHLYTAVFLPAFVKDPANTVIATKDGTGVSGFSAGTVRSWYNGNRGLDGDNDGRLTIAELGNRINKKKKEFGIPMQTGGVVATQGVSDTGPGYTIQGTSDASGRPVVFSQAAASAFSKMMKDSGGAVKGTDIASSKRSPKKNTDVGGATKSKHLYGIGMDIHGSSKEWIKKNGGKYGWNWAPYGGPGDHGGHFTFGGQGIQPSDVPTQNQESTTTETQAPEVSWGEIAKDLNALYKGLTGIPKTNGAALQQKSMDMIQTQAITPVAFNSDTYIIAPPTTIMSSVSVVGPMPQQTFNMNTSYAAFDSSSNYLQSRL
jgi:hypothetical protein